MYTGRVPGDPRSARVRGITAAVGRPSGLDGAEGLAYHRADRLRATAGRRARRRRSEVRIAGALGPWTLWIDAVLIALLNLPFGYWRAGLRKLSPAWIVAIHAPIPLAIGLRFATGLGFQPVSLPIFVLAYFTGQFAGARLGRRAGRRPAATEPSHPGRR